MPIIESLYDKLIFKQLDGCHDEIKSILKLQWKLFDLKKSADQKKKQNNSS